jgi:hypothetical protein
VLSKTDWEIVEQEQRHRISNRKNGEVTHCNTSKLDPSLNYRIVEEFTIVFLFLWRLFDVDVSEGPGRVAHLALIVVFMIVGR